MSRGLISSLIKCIIASPALEESNILLLEVASCAELLGRLIPKASIADAIVFAVYIPPHDPGPGIAEDSISRSSISEIAPSECLPTASKTETTSVLLEPGFMLPPYTKIEGLFNLAIAITQAGIFLSHPPIVTNPSKPCPPTTVSIESAITSLETREYRIPFVPIDIPSETVIVLKITAFDPTEFAPSAADSASLSICMLQGVTILHVEAMPTWGLLKSSDSKPTALNMALDGACSTPSTISEEYFLLSFDII